MRPTCSVHHTALPSTVHSTSLRTHTQPNIVRYTNQRYPHVKYWVLSSGMYYSSFCADYRSCWWLEATVRKIQQWNFSNRIHVFLIRTYISHKISQIPWTVDSGSLYSLQGVYGEGQRWPRKSWQQPMSQLRFFGPPMRVITIAAPETIMYWISFHLPI